tara:strand:- start:219 stop:413 length:195 start_codon:yes stop_codon:yes gene_type:complete
MLGNDAKGVTTCILRSARDSAHQAYIACTINQAPAILGKRNTDFMRISCIGWINTSTRTAIDAD